MTFLGNIVWFLLRGVWAAIGWVITGIICSITIIGIPFGKQCFKIAALQLAPFGKEVRDSDTGAMRLSCPKLQN